VAHIVVLIQRQVAAFSRFFNLKKRIEGMPYWRGKSILHLGVRWIMLATAVQFAFYAHPLFANPAGASVVNGAVNMQTSGNTLAITASDRSIINWQGFSIGAGETTQFIQPTVNASVLNRVTSGDASQIMGALQANGQVYLINPNGVFIGNGATINVGSFLASTANVTDESFMRGGNLTFSEASGAGIINRGTITANHGDVFLLAKTVENSGTIQAAQGTVGLMAGTQFFLKKDETGAVKVKVDSSSVLGVKEGTGVANSGVIEAMQAQLEAQGNVYALAINQSGIIRATGVSRDASGTIVLSAPGGMIRNTGTMLALNRDGSGGRLSISGQDVSLSDLSVLTAAGTGGSEVAVGGQIEIAAVEDAIVAGRLDVTAGGSAKGGRMVVTGRRVGVFGGKLDASGGTGGGEILLGGDYQGMNPLVRNAEKTYVSKDSIISADATVAGDGGKIITWSDNGTQFYGSATAKGGAVSGNGGFVEVSGRDFLDYLGSVNTLAPNGENGLLLLDPTDLTITTSASSNVTAASPFQPIATGVSNLQASVLVGAGGLGGGNVTVTTIGSPDSAGQTGTITIGTAVTWTSSNSLTISAASGGNIVINNAISNTTAAGSLVLNASGSGQIRIGANVTTTGGNLNLNGNTILTADVILTTTNGSMTLGAIDSDPGTARALTLVAGTGDITFTDAVGGGTGLGAIAITSARNTTFTSSVSAASLVYTASTGTALFQGGQTFSGALTVIANSGINYATGSSATVGGATSLTTSSSGASITLNGAISTTGSTFSATTTDGNILVGAAINTTASTGTVTLNAGGATKVLTLSADGDISSNGAVSLTGTAAINSAANITTIGDNVTFVSPTTLDGLVVIDTGAGPGDIAFSSTLGSSNLSSLSLVAGTGTVTFNGIVGAGGASPLGGLSVSSASNVTFGAASNFAGNVSITSTALTAAGTAIAMNAAATMTTSQSGTIQLTAAQGNLKIGTGGLVSDGTVTLAATTGNINLSGDITTTGDAINLNSSTLLGANVTLSSTNGNISINNTVNNGQVLTLNAGVGTVTFATSAVVGGVSSLNGLLVTGGTINLNSTTLTVDGGGGNTITFTGATVLGANVTIDTDGTSDNNVNFAGTVNADNATTQNRTLTVTSGTGTATFGGILGATGALADLDVTAATINLNTTGITVNDQGGNTATFTGAAVLGANVTINTDGAVDNNVNFTSTINADNATTQDRTLTVTAGTGTATLGGIVGATQALADMDVSAGTINLNANVTVDDQGGNTVIFTGATVLGANVAIDTDGTTDNNLSFAGAGTINSASSATPRNLTFNSGTGGTVAVTGAVGGTALLGTVTITQSGGVNFNSTVTANTVAITDSAAGADVAFLGNLTANTAMTVAAGTAAYDVLITGTSNSIAGSSLFSNTGQLTIGDAANDVSLFTGGLTAITQSAGFGAGFVRTAGGVVNLGAVTFTAATTIDTTNNGGVPAGANLTLAGALGGQNLALVAGTAGTVVLGAGTAAVANLTVTADEINFTGGAGSITATGAVLLQGATAATTIGVGGGAGTLDLNDTDLAAIADGATSITIGQAAQTALVTVDTSAFQDPVTIRSSGTLGEVQVDGLITATGATTSVTLQGATLDLNAGIDTAGGAVTLTGGAGGVDLATAQTINTAAAANSGVNSGAINISTTGAGTINIVGDLLTTGAANNAGDGSAGGDITISAVNGNVTITGSLDALGGDSSLGAGGVGGDISLSTTTGTIALADLDTSGGNSTLNNSNGGDAGTISISSTGGQSVTLNGSTITAAGGTNGGGTGVDGNGAAITFNNPVILATAAVSIDTTGEVGGNIIFNNTVSGTQDLTLAAGNGNISFLGQTGSGVLDPLGIVTVNSVNTFISSSTFEADQFVLAAAPLTSVTFSGGLSLSTSLTTIAGNYGFSITGAANSIAGDTNFLNQGALVLGNDALDVLTFAGGLGTTGNVTNPSGVSLAGTINTTDTQMDLGAVTLTAATTLDTGNSAAGVLNVGAVTSGGNSLTLDSGSTAGATIGLTSMANLAGGLTIRDAGGLATIGGAIGNSTPGAVTVTQSTSGVIFLSTVNATTVTLTDTANGQTITFIGNLTATTGMSAAANGPYNVSILGVANTIAGATTFANTGTVRLVVGGGTSVFAGGLTATAPSAVNIGGIVRAADAPINLGAVTLTTASTIDSAFGGSIGGLMTISSITGGGFNLALISRSQSTTVAGNATGLGTLELQDDVAFATGSMIFNGNLVANTLTTFSRAYAVQLNGAANTITTATTFNNLGALTIGQAAGSSTFTGGLVATANSSRTLNGTITTVDTAINLGTVTLGSAVTLDTGNAAVGTIVVGNVTATNDSLTLDSGSTAGATISMGTMTDLSGGLTIRDAGGLATIGALGSGTAGALTVTDSTSGVTFGSTVNATTVLILDTTGGASINFTGGLTAGTGMTVTGTGNAYNVALTGAVNTIASTTLFNNTGTVTIGDAAGDSTTFTAGVTATAPSAVSIAGTIAANTAASVITLGDAGTPVSVIATSVLGGSATGAISLGNATLADGVTLTVGTGFATTANLLGVSDGVNTGNLVVTANTMNFTSGAGSIALGGTVLLQGQTVATTIGVAGAAGTLQVTAGNIAAIADGATSITIGQALQTGLVTVNASTFQDPIIIRSSGTLGEVQVDGLITATGATTSVTLQGATLDLNAGIDTAGGVATLTGGIGGVDLAVAQTINTAAAANSGTDSGAVAITASGVGTINLSGDLVTTGAANNAGVGSAGGAVAITSATGTIALANISTSGGASTLANNNGGNAGTVGISSTGGSVVTLNASTITASGGVGGGGVIGVAGNGSAITFDNPVLLATGSSSIVTTGTVGGNVSFNNTLNGAQSLTVNAGTGTVTLVGSVGNTAGLTNLDITAALIRLNAAIMNLDGWAGVVNTSTFTGLVTLGANVSLDLDGALGNNNLLVTGTVDSASSLVPRNLTVLAGASTDGTLGNVTVTGAVGGTAPLANITVTGAGTLTSGTAATDNVTFTGDLTATANEMFFNGTEVRSTGGGTITLAPTTLGNGILVTGTTPLLPPANTLVLDTLDSIYTAGRLVIGSATSGAVTVEGAPDLSNTGYTGFSLLSQNATATFNLNSVLTLPTGTDIRFQLGTGNVDGTAELNSASLSPNLVSAGGTLRFVSVGSVSLYGSVANLQTSVSSGVGGGLVYLNEGTLNVIGSQTAAGQMLIGSVNGNLNLSSQLTGTKITAYAAQNFNNTFGSTAINLQGGRGLVYSTNPDNNNPSSGNGGLTGFGAAYLVPTPDFDFTGVGTYTIANAPAGSANLMAYSDPLPVSQLDSATLNQIVQTDAYLAAAPLTGATLPALPRSDVRLGFRMGGPQQRAPVVAPLGQVDKNVGTKGQSAEVVAPGRLKVSQMKRVDENKAVGQVEGRQPMVQPLIRIGVVSLRPSGEYLPFELAEVTMGGIRISQK